MDQTEEIDYDEIMRQQAEKLMAHKKGPCAKKKPLFGYREKKQFDSADYFNIQSHISNASEQTSPIGNALTSTSYIDDEETIPYTPNSQSDNKETGLENAIQLSMQLKKKVIQASSFGEQTFPMLVSLLADQSKTTSRAPIDLVCVIDHSGSMQGEKMKLVKNTFSYLLRYLKDSDRLSIVIFDNEAKRIVPLLRTTDQNKEKIINSVDRIRADGGTNITLGMVHAFEILKQRKYKNPVSSIFLLSDGLDSVASRRVKASLSGYSCLDDVTIHTFGFGHDHDPQLMSDIADLRDGNFYNIKELPEVDKAFVDCLGGLLSSVAQSVEVKIQPEQSEALQGVEIMKAYGDASMWTKEGQVYNTKMLSLISGRKKGFVLEIKIPTTTKELNDNDKNVKIASVEVQIVDLANQHVTKKADLYVTLLNEDEEVKEEDEEEADKEVMTNFYRVKGAALMQEARQLAEKSKFDDAKKILESFKEELENSFLKQEVFIKNLVTDVQKAIQYTSPQVYREIGKGALMSNARAQFKERTTFDSANYFQNKVQEDMLDELEAMKTK